MQKLSFFCVKAWWKHLVIWKLPKFKSFDDQKQIPITIDWQVFRLAEKKQVIYITWTNKCLLLY